MKLKKSNLLLAAAFMILLPVVLAATGGVSSLYGAVRSARPAWMLGALGLIVAYWALEAGILHAAVRQFHPGQRFFSTMETSMIGQFFNCVTPFASGGQPMQAFHMVKSGVPLGVSSCALMVKFIVYQFVLTIYSLITLLFSFRFFSAKVDHLSWLVLLGFGVNTAVILGLLCICLFDKTSRRFVAWGIGKLHRFHLVKDPEKALEHANHELNQFYEGFAMIRKNKLLVVRMVLLSVLQLTAYFMIPYMLLRGFGLTDGPLFTIISAQAFVLNISSFVPLPGAAGGAELSFHALFGMFFPTQYLSASILLWRFFTYYLPILAGGIFLAVFVRRRARKTHSGAAAAVRTKAGKKPGGKLKELPGLSDGAA